MTYKGDLQEDSTIEHLFSTHALAGGNIAPSSSFEAADIKIYKGASSAEKTTTNGITMTSPFDSIVGVHQVVIDTSIDTGDSGFWEAGANYYVLLDPDETIDGQDVSIPLFDFSIENRQPYLMLNAAIAEITGASDIPAAPTFKQAVMLLYMWIRNNTQVTASERRIFNDAGTEVLDATVSDNGTTMSQGKLGAP